MGSVSEVLLYLNPLMHSLAQDFIEVQRTWFLLHYRHVVCSVIFCAMISMHVSVIMYGHKVSEVGIHSHSRHI